MKRRNFIGSLIAAPVALTPLKVSGERDQYIWPMTKAVDPAYKVTWHGGKNVIELVSDSGEATRVYVGDLI